MAPTYKLTYFNGRGRAETIRLIFAYAKVPYEDIRVEREEWANLKKALNLIQMLILLLATPWGQLPFLDVDGVQLAQSNGIARFLAKRYGLAGENELEEAKCDEYVDTVEVEDILKTLTKWWMEKDEGKKAELKKSTEEGTLPRYYSKFESIITNNGSGVLVGKKLTFADFTLAFWVDHMKTYFPGVDMAKFPNLEKHTGMVLTLPGSKEWIERRPQTAF